MNVGTNLFTKIGDFVDEGDFGCKEGIGRVFDHFRRFARGEDNRCFNQIKRTIKITHHVTGAFVGRSDHNTIRPHEIANCGPFAQEFGVGNHREFRIRSPFTNNAFDFAPRADRYGRFGHDDGKAFHCVCNFFGCGINVAEIGVTITTTGRRANGNKDRLGTFHAFLKVGRECQTPRLDVIFNKNIKARLVDRHDAVFKTGNLCFVLINTDNVSAKFRETGTGDKPHISGPDHCYAHGCFTPIVVIGRSLSRLLPKYIK